MKILIALLLLTSSFAQYRRHYPDYPRPVERGSYYRESYVPVYAYGAVVPFVILPIDFALSVAVTYLGVMTTTLEAATRKEVGEFAADYNLYQSTGEMTPKFREVMTSIKASHPEMSDLELQEYVLGQ